MNKGRLTLHKKNGLNPTIPVCILCGKDKEQIALSGNAYKSDEPAPMRMLLDIEPCPDCKKKYLTSGVLLVEGRDNGTFTGRCTALSDEGFMKVFQDVQIPEGKICVITEDAMDKLQELFKRSGITTENNTVS
jgi:hypothetical protein